MKSLVVVFLLAITTCSAQSDSTVFKLTKPVEVTDYVFTVPINWQEIVLQTASGKDRKFNFTSVGIPSQFKEKPITATFTLRKFTGKTLAESANYIVTEFTSYPDRITLNGENYTQDTLQILSGETALFYTTRYYRRTTDKNYSRYDIIAYSTKRKACYALSITYQYKDDTYSIETKANFKAYATHIFKTLLLR